MSAISGRVQKARVFRQAMQLGPSFLLMRDTNVKFNKRDTGKPANLIQIKHPHYSFNTNYTIENPTTLH
jgi:hypothetical protein